MPLVWSQRVGASEPGAWPGRAAAEGLGGGAHLRPHGGEQEGQVRPPVSATPPPACLCVCIRVCMCDCA